MSVMFWDIHNDVDEDIKGGVNAGIDETRTLYADDTMLVLNTMCPSIHF